MEARGQRGLGTEARDRGPGSGLGTEDRGQMPGDRGSGDRGLGTEARGRRPGDGGLGTEVLGQIPRTEIRDGGPGDEG